MNKKIVVNVLQKISNILPLRNIILLESVPDLGCNTYPVFEEIINRKLNDKYKIIWLVNDKTRYNNVKIKNVKFINFYSKNIVEKMHLIYLRMSSKVFIFSNRVTSKLNKKQLSIFLSHGSIMKRLKEVYEVGENCDYMLNQSELFTNINSYELSVDRDKLICLGYPRNDYLYKSKDVLNLLNHGKKFDKVVIWLPTFRQHKTGMKDITNSSNSGIPIIESKEDFLKINDFLNQQNVLLMLKPHPAQDLNYIKVMEFSNLYFIDDNLLYKNDVHLYELLAQSDALITDYSSVYFDYLLLDKPIGLTINDIEDYSKGRGLVFENIFDILKGEYINNIEDMMNFLSNIKDNKDIYLGDRAKIKNLTNYYQDGESAKRVVRFIINKLEKV